MFIFLIKSNEGKAMGPVCLGQLLGLQHQTLNKTKQKKEKKAAPMKIRQN